MVPSSTSNFETNLTVPPAIKQSRHSTPGKERPVGVLFPVLELQSDIGLIVFSPGPPPTPHTSPR